MFVTTWFTRAVLKLLLLSLLLVFFPVCVCAENQEKNNTESCVTYYDKGVESYLENDFYGCMINFENAIEIYKIYRKKLTNCRIQCKRETDESNNFYSYDIENLNFFEKILKNTLCIIKCKLKDSNLFGPYNINKETEKLFLDAKPYEYLHICYYQNDMYNKAASAAFTYQVYHPDDKGMLNNLKYYVDLPGVIKNDIVNYEAKDYVYLYIKGSDAYEKKDWKAVEYYMEDSLENYIQSEEECRANCEGPFDQGWFPDFIPSIANHFTYCLRCKHRCGDKLNNLNGEIYEDLLPSHYHYLQYAYFKLGNLRAACETVSSYLLFYPDDETMLSNRDYYSKLPKAKDDYFIPRKEAADYVKRLKYEKKLLKYIYEQFKFTEQINTESTNQDVRKRANAIKMKGLNGVSRILYDNLLKKNECNYLISIAKMFAKPGDGYIGKLSPHTPNETFEGVTMSRAALLTYLGLMNRKLMDLYINITEDIKSLIENTFQIKRKLYFTYTHLVCRSAIKGNQINRTDLSHAIHADNCNLYTDGTCIKLPPAYTWRDFSAILYLNDDFEGGEFIFSNDFYGKNIQSVIKPKCGRLVAFSSGNENMHGVKAVKSGSRCAIGLWFTHNETHRETDRDFAYSILR